MNIFNNHNEKNDKVELELISIHFSNGINFRILVSNKIKVKSTFS
jgi:hypothetical protein